MEHLQLEHADPIADRGERKAQRHALCVDVRAAMLRRHRLRSQQVDQNHSGLQNLIVQALNPRRSHRLELGARLEH